MQGPWGEEECDKNGEQKEDQGGQSHELGRESGMRQVQKVSHSWNARGFADHVTVLVFIVRAVGSQ